MYASDFFEIYSNCTSTSNIQNKVYDQNSNLIDDPDHIERTRSFSSRSAHCKAKIRLKKIQIINVNNLTVCQSNENMGDDTDNISEII